MAENRIKYVYFGTRPTNVCWNGVSFPVEPGDTIICFPNFAETFFPAGTYTEVPKGSSKDAQKVRHTFGRSPTFLRTDPTGGLPMTSTPGPRKTKPNAADLFSPGLTDEMDTSNPYDLGVDTKPTIDMGTSMDTPSAPEPLEVSVTTVPPSEVAESPEEEDIVEDILESLELPEEVEVEVEGEAEPLEAEEEAPGLPIPTRTQVRGLKVAELKDLAAAHGIDLGEATTRGPILEVLWGAFKYDEE